MISVALPVYSLTSVSFIVFQLIYLYCLSQIYVNIWYQINAIFCEVNVYPSLKNSDLFQEDMLYDSSGGKYVYLFTTAGWKWRVKMYFRA